MVVVVGYPLARRAKHRSWFHGGQRQAASWMRGDQTRGLGGARHAAPTACSDAARRGGQRSSESVLDGACGWMDGRKGRRGDDEARIQAWIHHIRRGWALFRPLSLRRIRFPTFHSLNQKRFVHAPSLHRAFSLPPILQHLLRFQIPFRRVALLSFIRERREAENSPHNLSLPAITAPVEADIRHATMSVPDASPAPAAQLAAGLDEEAAALAADILPVFTSASRGARHLVARPRRPRSRDAGRRSTATSSSSTSCSPSLPSIPRSTRRAPTTSSPRFCAPSQCPPRSTTSSSSRSSTTSSSISTHALSRMVRTKAQQTALPIRTSYCPSSPTP
ncbi:hypothetical protein L1887_62336 [Cichorium endivia]|nr:hypothetical protein L1887_62336 [Cichorium endivia]